MAEAGRPGRGGARPGAGRKRTAEVHAVPISKMHKQIAGRMEDLVNYAFILAEGVWVEETGLDGEPFVYRKPPDLKAIIYLIDRVAGKPIQHQEAEITGKNGGPIKITEAIVRRPVRDDDDSD